MPRGVSRDAKHFREVLKEAVILKEGDGDTIDTAPGDEDPVWVAIVVNVTGYGPHIGAIYAYQNRFHGNPDHPLQEAFELLEDHERTVHKDYLKELEEEYGEQADEVFRETFDGWVWKLDPKEFAKAIKGTAAAKFIETYDSSED